jgi:hypothetical protein
VSRVSQRTGVLVVRAWVEDDPSIGLRARIVSTVDVNQLESETSVAASIDDVGRIVRAWLESLTSVPESEGQAGRNDVVTPR